MSATSALVQLSARSLDGVRTRPLSGGRAWCIFEGEHLAADPELSGALSELLRPIAVDVFPCAGPGFIDLVTGAQALASRTAVAVLRAADGRVGGMVSYVGGEWDGHRCYYGASAFVRPEEQGGGLVGRCYGMMLRNELMRAPLRPTYTVVRTPNPVVYAGWRDGVKRFGGAPEPRNDLQFSEETRRVAIAVARANGFLDKLDPDTLIVRGAYAGGIVPGGSGPYGARPRSDDADLDAMFDRVLGPEDALMVVGKVSLQRAARSAGDRAVRQRLRRLGGRRGGAVGVPARSVHVRVRGPERRDAADRRGGDRRGPDRRGSERRGVERRAVERRAAPRRSAERQAPGLRVLPPTWDGVERRAADRRALDRRVVSRRGGGDADRRGVERRIEPRRRTTGRRRADS